MSLTNKLLLGLIALLAGTALYIYFFRRKTATTVSDAPSLASQTALQAQLTSLTTQVQDKPSRMDVANLVQATQSVTTGTTTPGNTMPGTTTGTAPDTFIDSIKTKLTN